MSSLRARISVALCTRNGKQFVDAQIASILRQSHLPSEIVVSDDASSDDSVARIRAAIERHTLARADVAIKLQILQNTAPLGVAANFEQAILACRSPFIALCDQDDVWHPDRLERALAQFEHRPALQLVHCDARLIDADGHELPGTLFEALGVGKSMQIAIHAGGAFELLMKRNVVTGAATVIRRELAVLAAPFPDGWVHDEWLAIVAAAFDEIDVLDARLLDYRQHSSNQIGVRRLSVKQKLGRMLEPGFDRNRRLHLRAQSLVRRFESMGNLIPQSRLEAVQRKLLHEQVRLALPRLRSARIIPVLRELRAGQYGEFGRGTADAVRDLVQPLNPLG